MGNKKVGWFILGIVVLALAIFLLVGCLNYNKEKINGNSLLDKLKIYTSHENLSGDNLKSDMSIIINRTDINGTNITGNFSMEIFLYATSFNKSIIENLTNHPKEISSQKIDFPYKLQNTEVDTKDLLNKLGNNFEVCARIKIKYTERNNFWMFLMGPSKKELPSSCEHFSLK